MKLMKMLVTFLLGIGIICFVFIIIFVLSIIMEEKMNIYYLSLNMLSRRISLSTNDIMIYSINVIQLVVGAFLSILVYRLTKRDSERDSKAKLDEKINAIKYVKNEINYNKSIINVLELKKIKVEHLGRSIFKTEAWETYSIILVEVLSKEDYYKILVYYANIQLINIKDIKLDCIDHIKKGDELIKILNEIIK